MRMVRGPWIIGGDWNLSPEALAESGWVNEVEGKIIATKAPTCGAARLDFFVIDRRLGAAVAYIRKLTGFGTSPHHPVRLALKAEPRKLLVRTLVAPMKIPAVLPQGCLAEQHCIGGGEEGPEEMGAMWVAATLAQRLQKWFGDAEQVWVDIGGKEGEQRSKMMGRAAGPKLVWKCALGPPADLALRSTKAARSWRKLEGWCNAIKLAHTHRNSQDNWEHPLWKAAKVARRKLASAEKWCIGDEEDARKLEEFVYASKAVRWDEVEQIVAMAAWAQGEAISAEGKAIRKERARYQEWLKGGPMSGLARQHAASKRVSKWLPSKMVKVARWEGDEEREDGMRQPTRECTATLVEADGHVEMPANMQQEVDMETDSWASQWGAAEEVEPLTWPHEAADLPPITVQELKEAAAQFKDGVGLGWDRLHPRALLRLPDRLWQELCEILRAAEAIGDWSKAVGVVLIALLPKTDGGWRPIGLLPTLVRVWAKARLKYAEEWEAKNDRTYLYGGINKGAQVAAWGHAARAEAAAAGKIAFAAVLIDLEKAFERVPHRHLLAAAVEWKYPLVLLRMALTIYKVTRHVGIGGTVGQGVRARRGITAGSAFATRELRMLLLNIFDRAHRMHPTATLSLYVDDGTIEAMGPAAMVTETLVGATNCICDGMNGVGLTVSRTKNVVVASSQELGKAIEEGTRGWKVRFVRATKMLGTGAAAGIRRAGG